MECISIIRSENRKYRKNGEVLCLSDNKYKYKDIVLRADQTLKEAVHILDKYETSETYSFFLFVYEKRSSNGRKKKDIK
jgi:hypothetical protein